MLPKSDQLFVVKHTKHWDPARIRLDNSYARGAGITRAGLEISNAPQPSKGDYINYALALTKDHHYTTYPYRCVGRIEIDGVTKCTGTMVGLRTVLTSAHCYRGWWNKEDYIDPSAMRTFTPAWRHSSNAKGVSEYKPWSTREVESIWLSPEWEDGSKKWKADWCVVSLESMPIGTPDCPWPGGHPGYLLLSRPYDLTGDLITYCGYPDTVYSDFQRVVWKESCDVASVSNRGFYTHCYKGGPGASGSAAFRVLAPYAFLGDNPRIIGVIRGQHITNNQTAFVRVTTEMIDLVNYYRAITEDAQPPPNPAPPPSNPSPGGSPPPWAPDLPVSPPEPYDMPDW